MAHANGQPALDGEWTPYTPDSGVEYGASDVLIFVNGMDNTPKDHADTAKRIANLACHRVEGLYNLTGNGDDHYMKVAAKRLETDPMARAIVRELLMTMNVAPAFASDALAEWSLKLQARALALGGTISGFLSDVSQCAGDWMIAALVGSIVNEEAITDGAPSPFVPPELQPLKIAHELQRIPVLSTDQRMRLARSVFLGGNLATRALFEKLSELSDSSATTRIIAHSQGNLITANALSALCWAKGALSIGKVRVYSLASPVPRSGWPTAFGFNVRFFAHWGDPVAWLSLRKSYEGHADSPASRSLRIGHGIGGYLDLPEFVSVLRKDLRVPETANREAQAA